MNLKNLVSTGTFLLLAICLATAMNPRRPAYVFSIQGQVTHNDQPLDGVEINIYANGTLVKTMTDLEEGEFAFNLSLHRDFVIEFKKDGLVTKTATINSWVPSSVKKIPKYEMDISLISAKPGYDAKSLEMPFYMIEYDRYSKKFVYHAGHTVDMMLAELEASR